MALVSKWQQLARTAAAGWWNDRAMSLGAAISFFTLFSLAPMLLAVISAAGLVYGQEAAQGAIVGELGGLLGEEVASARDFGSGVVGTIVGVVLFLVLTTSAFVEIQDDLNVIWKVQPASTGLMGLVRTRLLSLSVVAGIGFLLLVSLVIDAGVTAMGAYLEARVSGVLALVQIINGTASFLFATLLFAMIFKILPAVDLAWRDVWTGVIVTGVMFTAGKVLIGLYIGRSGVPSAYGAAASVITIILWIYYSSLILLFGAEFTKAYAETHGSRT